MLTCCAFTKIAKCFCALCEGREHCLKPVDPPLRIRHAGVSNHLASTFKRSVVTLVGL